MTDNTKRTLRTLIQVLLAVATAVPSVINGLPISAVGAQVIVVAGLFTKYFYLAEKIPGFPSWLEPPVTPPSNYGEAY